MDLKRNHLLANQRILVLVEDLYEDLELWYPVLRFREEGAQVVLAGTGKKTYQGKHGYPVTVDSHINSITGKDFHAVVIPGGYAPDRLRRYPEVLSLIQDMYKSEKVVAAICHAAWIPISAGIVKGKRMTCFASIKDDLINAGALYEDAEVVRDGLLISSRQPEDLGAFCREIIQALGPSTG
ncbi:MAG: type 1 glutamine amidotransferase domain-containing protein [Nitrospirales bacterium]